MNGVRSRKNVAGPQQAHEAAEVPILHNLECDAAGHACAKQRLIGLLDVRGQSRVYAAHQVTLAG